MLTFWPSPPAVREIETPVMWLSESATLLSGKRPSSVALMLSCTPAALRFRVSDFCRLARVPVTSTRSSISASGGVPASWAKAGSPNAARASRPAAVSGCSAKRVGPSAGWRGCSRGLIERFLFSVVAAVRAA
jgi:hypothetical protein